MYNKSMVVEQELDLEQEVVLLDAKLNTSSDGILLIKKSNYSSDNFYSIVDKLESLAYSFIVFDYNGDTICKVTSKSRYNNELMLYMDSYSSDISDSNISENNEFSESSLFWKGVSNFIVDTVVVVSACSFLIYLAKIIV